MKGEETWRSHGQQLEASKRAKKEINLDLKRIALKIKGLKAQKKPAAEAGIIISIYLSIHLCISLYRF